MQAVLRKHGGDYQVSRVQTDQAACEWLVIVRYADETAYAKAIEAFRDDPEHRQVVAEISKLVTLVRRNVAVELDLQAKDE